LQFSPRLSLVLLSCLKPIRLQTKGYTLLNSNQKKVQTTVRDRAEIVEPDHPELTIKEQCRILAISRSAYYYKPEQKDDERELAILAAILEELRERPFYGYRKVWRSIKDLDVTLKQVRRIMKKAGLRALYAGKKTSIPAKGHARYPYLLRGKTIWLPNQVWATDITYIRLKGGNVYVVAIIDLYSRKVLSWRLSNTMDAEFCVSALEEAIKLWGIPAIFNTDQGSQFTSEAFIGVLESHGIRISMDGRNRALDNILVERFWRSLKYEDIYLKDYQSMGELKDGLKRYFAFYNGERFHESLDYETPDVVYQSKFKAEQQTLSSVA
jgi:putative transposase